MTTRAQYWVCPKCDGVLHPGMTCDCGSDYTAPNVNPDSEEADKLLSVGEWIESGQARKDLKSLSLRKDKA